jgi:hypothetical protein
VASWRQRVVLRRRQWQNMCWHASEAKTPQISLEPVAQGLVAEMEEAARGNI